MNWLIRKLAPGAIVTIAAAILAGVFSRAADSKPVNVPSSPAPGYSEPSSGGVRYLESDPRPRAIARDRCSECGARISADGRAIQFADRRDRDRRSDSPQVIYVVHVNGGNVPDLRDWPQSPYPLSTRFADPIHNRAAYVQDCGHH